MLFENIPLRKCFTLIIYFTELNSEISTLLFPNVVEKGLYQDFNFKSLTNRNIEANLFTGATNVTNLLLIISSSHCNLQLLTR